MKTIDAGAWMASMEQAIQTMSDKLQWIPSFDTLPYPTTDEEDRADPGYLKTIEDDLLTCEQFITILSDAQATLRVLKAVHQQLYPLVDVK